MKEKMLSRKNIFSITTLSIITLFTSCDQQSAVASPPVANTGAAPQAQTLPGSTTIVSETSSPGPYLEQIKELAGNSACAKYSWKDRGRAPAGYIKGVTLSYARSLCRLHNSSALAAIMSAPNSNNDQKDALAHYQNNFLKLNILINESGTEPLRADYVLGMGLGMRESSGTYCEGWDKSAGSNRPSSAAEAGLFQTSYDSMSASPELPKLYTEYKTTPNNRCFLDVFKEGASCKSTTILGTGAGADYQVFNKACPAFATEYAMTMLRIQRSHYGPINRLEAEVVPACDELLKEVEELVTRDPENACQDIF